MTPIERRPGHPWFDRELEALCKAAGLRWEQKHKARVEFNWHLQEYGNIRKKTFLPALLHMTRHCSFCDAYEMGPDIEETVEHFLPKSEFPEFAYQWRNLYLCCGRCQSRKCTGFDERLLRPDDTDYHFV